METGESAGINSTNLFLQDDILHHLFSVLPLSDLLNFRKVCKQWNRLCLPYINSSTWIHVNYPHRLSDFLDLVENSTGDGNFGTRFFLSSIYVDHPVTSLFFTVYGPFIRGLKLCIRDERQMSVENLEHLLVNQVPQLQSLEISLPGGIENQPRLFPSSELNDVKLPNLKSLRLCNNHGYHQGFLYDLFSAGTNVIHLKALLDNSFDKENMKPNCVILSLMESTGLYKNIRKLELESIVTEHHLRWLIELAAKGMALESLVFTQIHPRYFKKDTLQEFLLSQWLSLEYLVLDSVPAQYYWDDAVCLTLMQMIKLKSLRISGRNVALPAAQIVLYDHLPDVVYRRFDRIDSKLRKMKKKCSK